jgi:hypothetical protein
MQLKRVSQTLAGVRSYVSAVVVAGGTVPIAPTLLFIVASETTEPDTAARGAAVELACAMDGECCCWTSRVVITGAPVVAQGHGKASGWPDRLPVAQRAAVRIACTVATASSTAALTTR